MQVQVVNNTTSFYGSPNRAVFRYLHRLEEAEFEQHVRKLKFANKAYHKMQKRDAFVLDKIKIGAKVRRLSADIKTNLKDYTEKLHPDTKLVYESTESYHFLKFVNPLTHNNKCPLEFNRTIPVLENGQVINIENFGPITQPDGGTGFIKCDGTPNNISELAKFVENLLTINPEEIDKWFLDTAIEQLKTKADNAHTWFKKLMVKNQVRRIVKFNEKALVDESVTKESLMSEVWHRYYGGVRKSE